MVDFQSRDTRRGYSDDAEDDDSEDEAGSEPESADQASDGDAQSSAPSSAVPADSLGVGLVTVAVTDGATAAGEAVEATLDADEFEVATREVIEPSFDGVQSTVTTLAGRDDVALVLAVGGTGAGPEDVTPEAVAQLYDRDLPGFGELLRLLAHDEVGSGILTMRPVAGVLDATPVFCLPGEAWAARLGVTEIVVPEARGLCEAYATDEDV